MAKFALEKFSIRENQSSFGHDDLSWLFSEEGTALHVKDYIHIEECHRLTSMMQPSVCQCNADGGLCVGQAVCLRVMLQLDFEQCLGQGTKMCPALLGDFNDQEHITCLALPIVNSWTRLDIQKRDSSISKGVETLSIDIETGSLVLISTNWELLGFTIPTVFSLCCGYTDANTLVYWQ